MVSFSFLHGFRVHNVVHRLCCMSELQPGPRSFDDISDYVRRFCAERLYELEKSLRPWIDGSFGDISPAHLHAYVGVLRELGRLYEAHKRPRTDEGVPLAQVEAMLQREREAADARMAEAVAEAEARVRVELESSQVRSIEAAKQTALTKLQLLRERAQ